MGRPTARSLAQDVLLRVARDDAWAERALNAALERSPLERRDRALATELVYGTLRNGRWLDFLLAGLARKPLSKLPAAALIALRMSAFQIVASRIPDHSAVNEGVALVRRRHAHLSGVVNGILRQLARQNASGALADPAVALDDPAEALAVRWSHPTWLVRRVMEARGEAEALAWCTANNAPPGINLRVNRRRTSRAALAEQLRGAGIDVGEPPEHPDGLLLTGGAVEELPGFAAGHFVVQDFAAQLVGHLAAPRAEQIWLDACAAPGGKATHLAEQMEDRGRVVAVDLHAGKTRLIAANAARLRLTSISTAAADATDPAALGAALAEAGVDGPLDGVILDAPCTGSGTLRRNPELRTRLSEALTPWTERQDHLLASVAGLVAAGGVILYAVCSILPEEGEERVAAFLAKRADFTVERPSDPILQPYLTPGGALRTWPHLHGTDGFFAARLVRGAGDPSGTGDD